jgi:hypothetical protein
MTKLKISPRQFTRLLSKLDIDERFDFADEMPERECHIAEYINDFGPIQDTLPPMNYRTTRYERVELVLPDRAIVLWQEI